jgi:hypothetical protein
LGGVHLACILAAVKSIVAWITETARSSGKGQLQDAETPGNRPAEAPTGESVPKKSKRSTTPNEARAKLIPALLKHHEYDDGGCLNQEPIGNNELARSTGVSKSATSEFFMKEFKGYEKYRAVCRDPGRLADCLKALAGEFSPHHLYGRRPPGEDDRDGDE